MLGGEIEVLPQGHMGEQGVVLKDVAGAAGTGRQIDASLAIEEHFVIEHDAAFVGGSEPGDEIEGQRLTGAGRAKQDRDAGARFEVHVERERR